jgi:predicted nucleic acid-binding Zn ribbon protein
VSAAAGDRPTDPPPKRRRRQRGPDRGPQPLSGAMEAVLGKVGGGPRTDTLSAVFGSWPELVGADLAAHTEPIRIDHGVLKVAADHAAWATQMRTRSARTLEQIATLTDYPPERIDVTVRRV